MDILEILKAIVMGIIQGITEWLPISSTGHMILADQFIKLNVSETFWNTFLVVVQLGSILAVVVLFFHKLNPLSPKKTSLQKRETWSLWGKVLVAVVPAGIIGVLFDDKINEIFYNWQVVAATLILYGVLFIVVESRKRKSRIGSFGDLRIFVLPGRPGDVWRKRPQARQDRTGLHRPGMGDPADRHDHGVCRLAAGD